MTSPRHCTAFQLTLALLAVTGCATAEAEGDAAAAGRRADVAAFRRGFLDKDRSYSAAARAEAETRLAKLEASAGTVTQPYFELELGRIVALADNGHTLLPASVRSRHFNRIPLRLVPFGEDFAVLRARGEHADLLGAWLVAVDGRAVAEVRDVGRTLHGGEPSWRDRSVPYFLESPEQMHALGIASEASAATYRFRRPDGGEVERRLAGEPADPGSPRASADRWMFPAPLREEGPDWRSALDPARAPWSLSEPEQPFRWREAPEIDGVVIELRQNEDGERRTIGDFLDEVDRRLERAPPANLETEPEARDRVGREGPDRRPFPVNLVLDMRANGGGDLTTSRSFMKALAGRVTGRIFALTSPWTFSAAISSVGYLEQSAPARVTIVGEPVGDRLDFFSEGRHVELPRSGLVVLYATERHDYRNGCRAVRDCHDEVVRHPIAVPTLAPDIAAPWTLEAYLAGRDPGMEAVERELGR